MFVAVNSLLFGIIFSSFGRVVSRTSVIHGWFVYWVFGLEMRRLSKSEIRFRMAIRFRFSPCLIRKRSLKVSSDSGLT